MVNIAINGFGRIGRLFLRALSENKSAKNINVKMQMRFIKKSLQFPYTIQ